MNNGHAATLDTTTSTLLGDAIGPDVEIAAAPCDEMLDAIERQPSRARAELRSVRQLVRAYPKLREAALQGLLRVGETLNIIAQSKFGKSWLVDDLAIAFASGRLWLGQFQPPPGGGDVLILDNELHAETSADRVPKVAQARGILFDEYADRIHIENMRGQLRDIFSLATFFAGLEPGRFPLIILDAFYRFMPIGKDENDNGAMAEVYNQLDSYADRLRCSFVLIHHASKGGQANKAVTDVGAGAGSQARATDTHLILRQHEEDGAAVMEAAVRSFPPLAPMCLRWTFPVWTPAPDLDPTMLRGARSGRQKADVSGGSEPKPEPIQWTADLFVAKFASADGRTRDEILVDSDLAGLSHRRAVALLGAAESSGKLHRWTYGRNRKERYSTRPQTLFEPKLAGPLPLPDIGAGMGKDRARRLAAKVAQLFPMELNTTQADYLRREFTRFDFPNVEEAIDAHRAQAQKLDVHRLIGLVRGVK